MNTNILDFGAVAGGEFLTSDKIQAAIDACASSGGGRVTVPQGKYLVGTLWLRSGVELHLEHGSELIASSDLDDYNDEDAYEQNASSRKNEKWLGKHMIIALECENVAITGTGTLNGNGDIFMAPPKPWTAWTWNEGCRQAKDEEKCRPGQLVCFIECKRVTVRDITVTNQPCWGLFFHGCEYVSIIGTKTFNEHSIFNSDGIDIDCCKYVSIADCLIDTGDDCIAIRGNGRRLKKEDKVCEYITISNCVLGSCSSTFRIGVGVGKIRHVRVSNICITRGAPGICIMSSYMGNGATTIEDVSFSNISMANCSRPFEITEASKDCAATIKDVTVENVRAEVYGFLNFRISNENTVENIVFRNWKVVMVDGYKPFSQKCLDLMGDHWMRLNNTKGLRLENFALVDDGNYLSAWKKGVVEVVNCPDAVFENCTVNGEPMKF